MHTPLHSRQRSSLGWALVLLAALLFGSRPGLAQVDTYTFAPSAGTFTPLPAATATAVTTINSDDAVTGAIPIGFTFVFDGSPFTQVYANSNGTLSFNSAAPASGTAAYDNALATVGAASRPLAAPYWDDLTGAGGTASYLTSGTAPNRTFTFEWLNWRRLSAAGAQLSFQVQLVEGTNVVRFVYRQEATAMSGASVSIGLAGAGTGPGSFLSLSDATATPTASSTTETTTISTAPANGQVYTFTPAPPSLCPTPRNLAAPTVATNTATVSYTVSNTTPGPFTIFYGPTGFNPALASSPTNLYFTTTSATSTAALTGLTASTPYQFYVRQNCGGANGASAISNAGSFTTNPNPAANDECTQAVVITVGTACTTPTSGTVFGGTQSLPPTTSCNGTTAQDVWYSFVANSNSQTITFTPQFSGVYDVRSGTCANSTSLFCANATATSPNISTIGGLTSGQTYFLRVYASTTTPPTGTSSTFTLCIVPGPATPANDDCAGALTIPIQYGTCVGQTSADNTAATASVGVPAPACASYVGHDVWFKVTVPASGEVTVQTLPPTAGSPITDTGMAIYSGTCGTLALVECDDDDSPNGNFSLITLSGTTARTPGEILYVRAWAYNDNNAGLIAVCATSPSNCGVPLAPAAGTLTNTTAVLSWSAPANGLPAGGTYELEYGPQGFVQGTGTSIVGLTAATRTLTGLSPATAYCFYVRTNCGAANGSSAYVGPTCFTTPLTAPGNDEPCGATPLGTATVTSANVGATTSVQNGINLPACSASQVPKDVWFTFTPTATSSTLTVTGNPAGMLRVFTTTDCFAGPFTQVFCQASGTNNTTVGAVSVTGLTVGTRYYVAISGYGSSDTPGTFTIRGTNLVTATKAQAETNALLVYPNPSNTGLLTLHLSGLSGTGQASLLNALGQVVLTKALAGTTEQTLSTRGLAAGLYTLRVNVSGQVLTRKVVLE